MEFFEVGIGLAEMFDFMAFTEVQDVRFWLENNMERASQSFPAEAFFGTLFFPVIRPFDGYPQSLWLHAAVMAIALFDGLDRFGHAIGPVMQKARRLHSIGLTRLGLGSPALELSFGESGRPIFVGPFQRRLRHLGQIAGTSGAMDIQRCLQVGMSQVHFRAATCRGSTIDFWAPYQGVKHRAGVRRG